MARLADFTKESFPVRLESVCPIRAGRNFMKRWML